MNLTISRPAIYYGGAQLGVGSCAVAPSSHLNLTEVADASFYPKIVGQRQTSVGKFSEALISFYASGLPSGGRFYRYRQGVFRVVG